LFGHSVTDALDDRRQVVDLVLNVNWGGWQLGLDELVLGEAADVFVDVLADGFTGSLGGFLNYQARISLDPSDRPGNGFPSLGAIVCFWIWG
jgi:hypothetical protein